jgi:hypothetical protein
MMALFHISHDLANDAVILRNRVAHLEVLQRDLVPKRNILFRLSCERLVIAQVSAGAFRPGFDVDYGYADIVRCVMSQKMNHRFAFSPYFIAAKF